MSAPGPSHHVHAYACELRWTGAARGPTTSYAAYARDYEVLMAGKPALEGSADAVFRGDPSRHSPEDLLLAALSACHCLSFLALAARRGLVVLAYEDSARGTMQPAGGVTRFTEVVLAPRVTVAEGSRPELVAELHALAHAGCYIASSVNFPVRHEPSLRASPWVPV